MEGFLQALKHTETELLKGINVGYKHFRPKELNYKRVNPNPTGTELKQYATIEDKMAKLEREQQNYTVWEEDDG